MKLLQVHLSSVAQTAFQRLHWKAEHPFGFLMLWMRDLPTPVSQRLKVAFAMMSSCPEKLLTEEANSVARFSFASSSLLLESRLVSFFIQVKNGMGNMPRLFSLGIITG